MTYQSNKNQTIIVPLLEQQPLCAVRRSRQNEILLNIIIDCILIKFVTLCTAVYGEIPLKKT